MDEMRFKTKFMRGLLAKIAKMAVKKKTGYEVDIQLNELEATVVDGSVHVRLNTDLTLPKEEFDKLLKMAGL